MAQITTQQQLADALWAPKPGETYQLIGTFAGGRCGTQKPVAAGITLDCSRAVFTGAQNWWFVDGVTVLGGHWQAGLSFNRCNQVTVKGATFDKGGIVVASGAGSSAGADVEGCSFFHGDCGVSCTNVKGVRLVNNGFHAMTGDCFNTPGCQDVYVGQNRCSDGQPAPLAHPDFLQTWASPGGLPMSGYVIEDNSVFGPTQGLFLPNGVVGIAQRNHIVVSYPNAIAVGSGSSLQLQDNVIATMAGAANAARVAVYPGGAVQYLSGNIVNGALAA